MTARRPVLRIHDDEQVRRPDTLAVEEPLEIRVDGEPLVVTMRTPGHDVDLAHGYLSVEGLIHDRSDVVVAKHCPDSDLNVLEVTLRDGPRRTPDRRSVTMTSACGICGKESIDAVARQQRWSLPEPAPMLDAATALTLPDKLRVEQRVFERTGGLHAAGIFGPGGELRVVREDVGRHNAVDKAVGWAVREGVLPLHDAVLVVSGRASYELVQKAVLAGIPMMIAVSAPSSLAVDLAEESGLTLIGFARGDSLNVYSHADRVLLP